MMKKCFAWLLTAVLAMGMLAGCQKEEKVQEEPVQEEPAEAEEPEEPEVITLGEESPDAIALYFKNSTGKELTDYWMRASAAAEEGTETEENDWGDSMMPEEVTVPAGEVFLVYYLPEESTETTEDKLLCDISWGYGDGSYIEVDEVDVLEPDMTNDQYIELCTDTEASYVKYISTYTGEAVDNKEAVLAKMASELEVVQAEVLEEEEEQEESTPSQSSSSNKSSSAGNSSSSSSSSDSSSEDTSSSESSADYQDTQQSSGASDDITEECGHYYDAAGNEVFPE
ncbi:MAG: hypothetical protein ACOYBL_12005 [Lachnospiraceae bacterium]